MFVIYILNVNDDIVFETRTNRFVQECSNKLGFTVGNNTPFFGRFVLYSRFPLKYDNDY